MVSKVPKALLNSNSNLEASGPLTGLGFSNGLQATFFPRSDRVGWRLHVSSLCPVGISVRREQTDEAWLNPAPLFLYLPKRRKEEKKKKGKVASWPPKGAQRPVRLCHDRSPSSIDYAKKIQSQGRNLERHRGFAKLPGIGPLGRCKSAIGGSL
jgi:hypothetical protein